ncbi:nickel-dependent hydrogenase large subunit [Nitratifractor sp.]
MIKQVELIEKIEGEAEVSYTYEGDRIADAQIRFLSGRGIESILTGRPPADALAITPRVCGICGHAHLIATVRALEACFPELQISPKAAAVRELTLTLELLQNHFKWFYLTIWPLLFPKESVTMKAVEPSRIAAEAIALLAGQYPHNSYALPGGIVGEITPLESLGVGDRLERLWGIFRRQIADVEMEAFLRCDRIEDLQRKEGDLSRILREILDRGWERLGRSHDRFIVFGSNGLFVSGKSLATRITSSLDLRYLEEEPIEGSAALRVLYREKVYETGPLARAMLRKTPLIREAHRRWGDSLLSRIMARVCEIPHLLRYAMGLTRELDLDAPAWIDPGSFPQEAEGVGIVEAARGSLIHRIVIRGGRIANFQIVTPTQWNLGSAPRERPGVAQKALIGLHRDDPAELVFKSFDVCSVCTTH